MPDFGISTGISRLGAQPLPANPFGTPSLDALVNGGAAFASAGNTPKKHCYEIFIAEIIKTKLEAPGEEQNPQAWGVNQKLGGSFLKLKNLLSHPKIGIIINFNGHIYKKCRCLSPFGISGWTTEPALLRRVAKEYSFYPGDFHKDYCKPGPTNYKCFALSKTCGPKKNKGPNWKAELCGSPFPPVPPAKNACPCRDEKKISLAGVTHKTKEHTLSNGTKIKLAHPGNFEEVMHQIVVAEKNIKLKCETIIPDDHPAKKPPEER